MSDIKKMEVAVVVKGGIVRAVYVNHAVQNLDIGLEIMDLDDADCMTDEEAEDIERFKQRLVEIESKDTTWIAIY